MVLLMNSFFEAFDLFEVAARSFATATCMVLLMNSFFEAFDLFEVAARNFATVSVSEYLNYLLTP